MLAMHYAIELKRDEVGSVRDRIDVIGPVFDTLPGLVAKAFLLASDPPCYSLYYLWASAEAAEAFLTGPRFDAVREKYGYPAVTLYFTEARRLPFAVGDRIAVRPADAAADGVALLDPRTGRTTVLDRAADACFEVRYVAGPNGADDRPVA